jgi:[ribosomal protein S5]-alanine N-acetyltransferase
LRAIPIPKMDARGVGPSEALSTPRLRIEPLEAAHAAELFGVLRDPRIYTFLPEDAPKSAAELEARYARWARGPEGEPGAQWFNWIVREGNRGTAIGTLQATVDPENHHALVAYLLGPEFWGRGYAAEGLSAVLEWLISRRAVTRLEAIVDSRNERSIRLLERLGFERVATQRRAEFFKGGWSDELRFRRTATGPGTTHGV